MPDHGWLETVAKYLVLPIGVLVVVYFIADAFINAGRRAAADFIASLMNDYEQEYEAFSADGTIDSTEESILKVKSDTMKPAVDAMSNSILDPNKVLVETAANALLIAGIFLVGWKVAHGDLKIGSRAKQFYDTWKDKIGKQEASVGNQITLYNTAEELTMVSKMMAINQIADLGNTTLASNLYAAEQNFYFASVFPQMQSSANILSAQIASGTLVGVQLAYAQAMLAQYNLYLTYFTPTTMVLPPPFLWVPI